MVSIQAMVLAAALSATGETVLLDFTAPWCGPCRTMEPTIHRLQQAGFPIRQIDLSRQPSIGDQYHVTGVPCFILLVDGREVDRMYGATSYERLVEMMAKHGAGAARQAEQAVRQTANDAANRLEQSAAAIRAQSPESLQDRLPLLGGLKRLGSLGRGSSTDSTPGASSPPPADPNGIVDSRGASANPAHDSDWTHTASTAGERSLSPSEFASTARNSANARESNAGRDQSATRRALYATVRLRVEDPDGNSFGTGTIIDTHGGEALIVTCGHLFRDSRGKGRITIDTFLPGGPQQVPGVLIAYDADQRDIALVAFKPGVPIESMPVAPSGYAARPGDRVFSLGCDRGQDASVRESHVTAVDKYMNAPNIEVAGMPVDGRSGGGLFTADGQLIGVCNAADPADNEGIYASLPTIHWQLDQSRLSHVYRRPQPTAGASSAQVAANSGSAPNQVSASNAAPVDRLAQYEQYEPRRMAPVNEFAAAGRERMPTAMPAGAPSDSRFDPRFDSRAMTGGEFTAAASTQPNRAFEFATPTAGDLQAEEVICIVRSRANPNDRRMIVVQQPSAELLDRLSAESRQSAAAAELANRYREQDIMRAQSADR